MTEKLFLINDTKRNVTYCFILWKLYNQVSSGNLKNLHTGEDFSPEVIQNIFKEYSDSGRWEKLRHEYQPLNKTRGLSITDIMGLKLMQFGVVPRPPSIPNDSPFLIIGTIPLVPPQQEGMFASRFGINSDIIITPRPIDTVVNVVDYKGMVTVCNIWEECKELDTKSWQGIYFNHIPLTTIELVVTTLKKLSSKLLPKGILIYQTDIRIHTSSVREKLHNVSKYFPGCFTGITPWNDASYGWIVLFASAST